MGFIALLKSVFIEMPAADETVWHKRWHAPFLAQTIDGKPIGHGQIWRRKYRGKWEYRQDEETDEEYGDRIW